MLSDNPETSFTAAASSSARISLHHFRPVANLPLIPDQAGLSGIPPRLPSVQHYDGILTRVTWSRGDLQF